MLPGAAVVPRRSHAGRLSVELANHDLVRRGAKEKRTADLYRVAARSRPFDRHLNDVIYSHHSVPWPADVARGEARVAGADQDHVVWDASLEEHLRRAGGQLLTPSSRAASCSSTRARQAASKISPQDRINARSSGDLIAWS